MADSAMKRLAAAQGALAEAESWLLRWIRDGHAPTVSQAKAIRNVMATQSGALDALLSQLTDKQRRQLRPPT